MRQYGMPYKGSKSKIAEWVVDVLPPADNLIDLFAGGCAVSHCALFSHKWNKIIANDIEPGLTQMFLDAVNGKYRDEKRWISRESFRLLKETDPYIKFFWSFGNNGKGYMYAPEVERFKEHLHYMFFSETPKEAKLHWKAFVREFAKVREEIEELTKEAEMLCKECDVEMQRNPDGTVAAGKIKDDVLRIKSAEIRRYMRDALKKSGRTAADVDKLLGTNGMAGHYFGTSQWMLPTAEAYEKMQTIIPDLTIPWGQLNESLQSLQSLESLESLQSLERLEVSEKDYKEIEIPENSVIYCDIPYKGTDGYSSEFDYEAFYDWCMRQTVPVYISEYNMPEDRFRIVAEREHRSSLAQGSRTKTVERIYEPRKIQ